MVTVASSLSPPPSTVVLAANVVLYGLLTILAGIVSRQDLERLSSIPKFIATAALLRIAWFGSEYAGWGDTAECRELKGFVGFAGRMSTVLHFSAFSAILFFWWESLQGEPAGEGPDAKHSGYCEPRTADILLKFWVFVIMAGLFGYKFLECDADARERVTEAEIVAMAVIYAALAVGFAAVGSGLRVKLSFRESVSSSQLSMRIMAITLTCVVLFLVRAFLLLLYPVFDVKLKGAFRQAMYPWFFYTIPEVVPCAVLLYTLLRRRKISVSMEDALLIAPVASTSHHPPESSLHIFRV